MPLSTTQIKDRLLAYVEEHPGCTAIELAIKANIADETHSLDLPILLETMVNFGELSELAYMTPSFIDTVKTVYFPNNSNVSLSATKEGINVRCDDELKLLLPKNTKTLFIRHQK